MTKEFRKRLYTAILACLENELSMGDHAFTGYCYAICHAELYGKFTEEEERDLVTTSPDDLEELSKHKPDRDWIGGFWFPAHDRGDLMFRIDILKNILKEMN